VLHQFISSGIEVHFEYAPEPAHIVIDRSQVEQVVLHLSMNARDAMMEGGILHLRTKLSATEATGREVVLGSPRHRRRMDEATRARIFEPFFTTKPQGQGTGLSLATVYGIVTNALLPRSETHPADPLSGHGGVARDPQRAGDHVERDRTDARWRACDRGGRFLLACSPC